MRERDEKDGSGSMEEEEEDGRRKGMKMKSAK